VDQDKAFSDSDSRAAWNAGADAWDEFVESGADYYRHAVHGPALLGACGPVQDLDVLDLGCGQGFFCRQLARSGARVVAIDVAEQQIAHALLHEKQEPTGVEYHNLSATGIHEHFEGRRFHLITACMALHDMADVATILHGAFALLPERGRMVFSIPHPCTTTPFREWERDEEGNQRALKIDHYFDSGPAVCRWRMHRLKYHWETPFWRYTLAEWSEMIAEAGFLIRRVLEPRPTKDQVRQNPHIEDSYRLPSFLIFDLVKLAGQ
jgi:2-polyprenyl-3-methyl-5-hydroxy-6-metoxy-1,4-benzoquinol methylase